MSGPARMNIPNALTIGRIWMAPLLVVAMLPSVDTSMALLVFTAGMATDMADGYLARSRGLITRFGALMDPVADKLFVGAAFLCLAATNRIAAWVVAVVFARELLVTVMRYAARRRGVIIAANALGKAKTAIQAAVVVCLLLAAPDALAAQALVHLMVLVTVVSGLVYAVGYARGRRMAAVRIARAAPRTAIGAG